MIVRSDLTDVTPGRKFRLAVDSSENNYLDAVLPPNLFLSDKYIIIGGTPIALYDLGSGRHAIGVFNIASSMLGGGVASDKTMQWGGVRMGLGYRSGSYILSIRNATGASDQSVVNGEVFYGLQIGKDSGNRIFLGQVSGAFEETANTYIGGMPLLVVRQDRRWHLAVRFVS